MDKEKQKRIEEMKQILIDYAIKHDLCFSFETMRKHAEVLYNANYRKITENETVISKEELEKLKEYIVDLRYDKLDLKQEMSEKDNKIKLLEETIE